MITSVSRYLTLKRSALMLSCAAAALLAQPAHAQQVGAFQGSIGSTSGTVTRNPTSGTTETITIGSNTATINWTPFDQQQGGGTINFLPNGNVATFTSSQGLTDYTVLNRIVPADSTRAISLNGQVISTLEGTSTTGGRIWFFSPGGIVLGSTAKFDVGSLLLTTNDVSNLSTNADGFSATFTGPASSTSKIQIMQGAEIKALQQNSYIAMIAPRIEQGGNVRVNGSAAYAAGEQVTMTVDQGLFAIAVDIGTTDANGIVHTGETGGPASSAIGDNHGIYMVAVPKNQALTMLLGGNIGFDAATNAQVVNGQIILSSGFTADGGTTGLTLGSQGATNFTSPVFGNFDGPIAIEGNAGGVNFAEGVTLTSDGNLSVTGTLTAGTSLALYAGGDLSVQNATVTGASGVAYFFATGTANFTGTVEAANIFSASADLNVATGASLGVWGVTNLVALSAMNDLGMYIGDNAAVPAGAYALNEDGDIRANTVTLNAFSASDAAPPDITIGDVDIDGSQTPGGGISNIIVGTSTNASIHVIGDIVWTDAGASDNLTLNAGNAVEVNTDTGSILMTDSAGKLAGSIILNAPNIWITDGAILRQLEADPNFAGRDAALATNGGTSNPLGFVGAGGITALLTDSFFVQNSGTANDMGGITVGDSGFFVENFGPTPAAVTIYGRQIKSDGTTVTGNAFAGGTFKYGTFTAGSAINQCDIAGTACSPPPPPPPPT